MKLALGPSWNPVDAVLQFMLSVAADDLITSDVFVIPSFSNASTGFGPRAYVRAGEEILAPYPELLEGSFNYMEIHDDIGGSFEISADISTLEWAILRIR